MSKNGGGTLLKQSDAKENSKAILLTENDVVKLRYERIQNWPKLSEM